MTVAARSSVRGRPASSEAPLIPSYPSKASLGELLWVTARALSFWPPLWVQSFLGPVSRWLPPHDEMSEFTIVDPRRAGRALEWLSRVAVPSIHREPPVVVEALLPRLLSELFWRPTTLFRQPERSDDRYPRERWFFINGIATNEALARLNAGFLTRLFDRPITVIQNSTNSIGLDLGEAAIGKELKTDPDFGDRGTFTEPGLKATIAILDALCESRVDRVVVVAHSQGTIIAANVLRAISKALRITRAEANPVAWIRAGRAAIELTSRSNERLHHLRRGLARSLTTFLDSVRPEIDRLEKLEVYTFANCADKMKYVVTDRGLPLIEHFANERDWVARLGILSPYRDQGIVEIDGPVFVREARSWPGEGWGHLFNDCYLAAIRDHLEDRETGREAPSPYRSKTSPEATPRLYEYFRGGSPASSG